MLNPRFFSPGTGSSAMMDGELKKTSVRANRLEKKRFEMMLSAYDSAKRNLAMEMKRSQVDVKRRLQRYKERQREITFIKSESEPSNSDEYMLKQIRRLSQAKSGPVRSRTSDAGLLPLTFYNTPSHDDHPVDFATNQDHAETSTIITTATATTTTTEGASGSTLGSVTLPAAPEDGDQDLVTLAYHHHHQQKSKADLRPYVAWSMMRSSDCTPDPNPSNSYTTAPRSTQSTGRSTSSSSSVKLLQLKGGRLGTLSRQVRYLDDEEIEQRRSFHRLLLGRYRHLETQRLERINDLVGEFCGKTTRDNRTVASCPPLFAADSQGGGAAIAAVSLPAGVPPSVHRAMRVKVFPVDSLEQWAKTNASIARRSENKKR